MCGFTANGENCLRTKGVGGLTPVGVAGLVKEIIGTTGVGGVSWEFQQ